MSKVIAALLLLLSLTNTPSVTAQTRPQVGAVAIRAFIITVDDARVSELTTELNSIVKSPQATPFAAYQAIKGLVNEQVRKKVARREWEPDPEVTASPDKQTILNTTSLPLPPLRKGKSKKQTPAYNINGTTRGRQLAVTPSVDAATGRTDKLTFRYSITSLPNSAVFVGDPHQPRAEPSVIGDLIQETMIELPASGAAMFTFKSADEPGKTTLFIIIGVS